MRNCFRRTIFHDHVAHDSMYTRPNSPRLSEAYSIKILYIWPALLAVISWQETENFGFSVNFLKGFGAPVFSVIGFKQGKSMSMGERIEGIKLEFWGVGKKVGSSLVAGSFA